MFCLFFFLLLLFFDFFFFFFFFNDTATTEIYTLSLHDALPIRVPRQELLSCGGPPQTSRSSRRQQQDEPRNAGFGIERVLELRDVTFRECDHRLLAASRGARTPQVGTRQQYKNRRYRHADESLFFHLPENLSAMSAAISCRNRIIPTTTT